MSGRKGRGQNKIGKLPKWVFSTLREGNAGRKLTTQQVWKTLKTYAKEAGIEKVLREEKARR
ncbi:hypothetical protein K9M78_08885 [Candidatus Bipolaricaulota bacterium]|nr:hypothetical protein [Candidatus Bipolaricaulota bacterium]